MADTITNKPQRRFNNRTTTVFGSAIVAALIIALLVYERTDVLYVLATISLVVLLVVVATANLEGKSKLNL